ncbi:serine hydrolase domain-containing protein [Solwaraspora sp. WMMA2065]|uniref:serine hydrolase domain-containing protein n=1 Tax=Solwaraspora sp. WMMA2065 TaxID=3015166 RepID=UPI00259B1E51|nr:serine hydrolase domain-containing protein [Solwaraspora sp. WMMA2065]WJK36419.1 serine hydrolase domain-containing protein [Solwaraspora sp. WMMA2065]
MVDGAVQPVHHPGQPDDLRPGADNRHHAGHDRLLHCRFGTPGAPPPTQSGQSPHIPTKHRTTGNDSVDRSAGPSRGAANHEIRIRTRHGKPRTRRSGDRGDTVEQVASNRACVRHYAGTEADDGADPDDVAQWQAEDTDLGTTWYANATAAAAEFWDSDLVCSIGDPHYSTHGYTILGAALEGATGTPVGELTESELTAAFNLGTLRPENLSDTSVRRSTFYDGANDEYGGDEVSWKVLGGGMESSVADLARFGDKLIGGEIVGPDSLDPMWVDTGWSYAYGWSISTEDGHRRIGKTGGADGSTAYLQMYPDDGIVVAVLMNRADGVAGENRAGVLGSEIGTLVLNTLP